MAKKGLLTLLLGGGALVAAGYAATSTAAIAVLPVRNTPITVTIEDITISGAIKPITLPARPPARSLYRPGPRNPPTVLE